MRRGRCECRILPITTRPLGLDRCPDRRRRPPDHRAPRLGIPAPSQRNQSAPRLCSHCNPQEPTVWSAHRTTSSLAIALLHPRGFQELGRCPGSQLVAHPAFSRGPWRPWRITPCHSCGTSPDSPVVPENKRLPVPRRSSDVSRRRSRIDEPRERGDWRVRPGTGRTSGVRSPTSADERRRTVVKAPPPCHEGHRWCRRIGATDPEVGGTRTVPAKMIGSVHCQGP